MCVTWLGHCGQVFSMSTCQTGGLWFKCGILPLLKHACGESDQLLCWPYTPVEVSYQRWISGNVYHIRLWKVWIRLPTLALKPRGDITRSPKQEYQWPQKWTCVQQNFLKKCVSLIVSCTQLCELYSESDKLGPTRYREFDSKWKTLTERFFVDFPFIVCPKVIWNRFSTGLLLHTGKLNLKH